MDETKSKPEAFDKAVKMLWIRELKYLPIEIAIEKKRHEITAAMIRDENLRSLFVPEWMIGKRHGHARVKR